MSRRPATILAAWLCLVTLYASAAPSAIWLDVPFVKQEKDGCGAASIAMVLQYWQLRQGHRRGPEASAEQIQRELYSAEAHGIYASEVEGYFRRQGFQTFAFAGKWADLQQHLAKGRPLMVALKPGGASLHYVVVAGVDAGQGIVMLNDPARRKLLKQDRAGFEREWSAAGNWTLLALPPAQPR